MVIKCEKYVVKYKWNVDGSNQRSYTMTKTEAKKFVKKLKFQNKIISHNIKIIRGKPFETYKNIKITKQCKRR